MELLGLDLSALLASRESAVLHAVLELDALGIGPCDVITEAIPIALEVRLDIVSKSCLRHRCLDSCVDSALYTISGLLPLRAIVVVEGKHEVVRPAVHLDWEDRCLERKSLEAHLIDPGLEVEAVDGWDSVVLLTGLQLVVVLSRRVETQEHSLRAQDSRVVPRGLDVDLCDVVELVHEGVSAT